MIKKKVLFVAPNLHHGGAEAVLVKILNNINTSIYEVKLVLVKKEGSHLIKLNNQIDVIDLKSNNAISTFLKLKTIIDHEKPDVVFSIIGHINIILASIKSLFFKNIKFVGRENVVYSEWLYKERNLKKRVLAILYKILLKKLDYVIVQSKFMAEEVLDLFEVPISKIKIINNPIEHKEIEKKSLEGNLGERWNEDKINLIAIGRIEEVKNYFEMVDIVELLPSEYHLNILGDGKDKEKLGFYIQNKNLESKVTLHGYIENPYKFIRKSNILLLTSHRESFPNVVLEANACGVYVVSYLMPGGIKEIINDNINGSIISLYNKELFAEEIKRINKKSPNTKAIIQETQDYSVDKFMEKIYKLL